LPELFPLLSWFNYALCGGKMRQRKPSSTYGTVRFTGGKAGRCRKIFKNPDFEKSESELLFLLCLLTKKL